jgi:hypothetical protein
VGPPRMRSNAVGGGGLYFMLGVGGCNYDASTLDSYPLPNMLDFQEKIAGCPIFTKVDLRRIPSR